MMPPSPWLSARMIKTMYLMETIKISAQVMSDKMPYTWVAVCVMGWWLEEKTSRSV